MPSIRHSWTFAIVSFVAAAAIASCAPGSGVGTAENSTDTTQTMDPIARGEYISRIGGCNDCHTPGGIYGSPDETRRLAGSEIGWQGPWGTSYGRNLTPDVETGIGSWTEEQIIVAVRTGQRPDGTRLLPPMPWPNYSALTDEDAHALAKYLKSIPAVKHANPPTLPPGQKGRLPAIPIPGPGAWDAPKSEASASGSHGGGGGA